jgi:hypothetical protein
MDDTNPNISNYGGARRGAGRKKADDVEPSTVRYNRARADKEEQAAILKKLEVQDAVSKLKAVRGDLVSRAEVEKAFGKYVSLVVSSLNTLPDVVERDVGVTGDIIVKIQSIIDKVRRELHERLIVEFTA